MIYSHGISVFSLFAHRNGVRNLKGRHNQYKTIIQNVSYQIMSQMTKEYSLEQQKERSLLEKYRRGCKLKQHAQRALDECKWIYIHFCCHIVFGVVLRWNACQNDFHAFSWMECHGARIERNNYVEWNG